MTNNQQEAMTRLLFLLFAACILQTAQAQVPQTLGYQGVLTDADSNPLADDDYSLTFSLYAEALGGDALWTETQSVAVGGGVCSAHRYPPAFSLHLPGERLCERCLSP